jgi:hypothetical protein
MAALAQLRQRPPPTPAEALDEPLRAFPSRFLRITCLRRHDHAACEQRRSWRRRQVEQQHNRAS